MSRDTVRPQVIEPDDGAERRARRTMYPLGLSVEERAAWLAGKPVEALAVEWYAAAEDFERRERGRSLRRYKDWTKRRRAICQTQV